ncbi:hypothetical protein SUGI_0158670 [Cryptomeria japonica]|nr:hypothetical protein SUGI_0158670 [Cryptomeria japonica]
MEVEVVDKYQEDHVQLEVDQWDSVFWLVEYVSSGWPDTRGLHNRVGSKRVFQRMLGLDPGAVEVGRQGCRRGWH